MSYADACRKATTDQGLDPIVDVLTALEIPITVDQTGGFTMVARVQLRDHDDATYLGITEEVHQPKPRYLVCRYDGIEDYDPVVLDGDASLLTVVALASAFMRDEIGDESIMVTCDICSEGECTEAQLICDACAKRIATEAKARQS